MLYRIILYVIFALVLILGFNFLNYKHVIAPTAEAKTMSVKEKIDFVFEAIAHCESYDAELGKNNLHAKNPTSSASGEFQFINGSWYYYGLELWGEDFYTKNIWSNDNRELADYVYKKYGTRDWEASRHCWEPYSRLLSSSSGALQ